MKHEQKEIILEKSYSSVCLSWTYAKMTEEERQEVSNIKDWIADCGPLNNANTEKQIQTLWLVAYNSYLRGIGYDGAKWRK